SYTFPGDDGKTHSGLATLLTSPTDNVYWLVLETSIENVDLLNSSVANVFPELAQIHSSFMVLAPKAFLVPTSTPTPTDTATVTASPTRTPTNTATATNTATNT